MVDAPSGRGRLDAAEGFGLRLGVIATRPTPLLSMPLLVLVACSTPERREWRASDHSQPPGVTAAPPAAETQPVPPEVARLRAGAALFSSRCASCHGQEGHGDGPGAPPMARPADLTQAAWQTARSDEQIASVIRTGRGAMPGFGSELAPEGIDALVAHVRALGATR